MTANAGREIHVWLDRPIHHEALDRLRDAVEVVGPFRKASADPRAELAGADGLIVSSIPRIDGAFMDAAGPQLRVVARPGVGIDNIDVGAATARGVAVVHTPDGPTESTAEHAIALLLALAKRVREADANLRTRGWDSRQPLIGTEVAGKVLGLVGLGRIGGRVAQIARALNMRVLVYDPYIGEGRAVMLSVKLVEPLDNLLATADFVSLHTPLTRETQGLIGAEALARMKSTAYLINCARGPIVDEVALFEALRSGTIAGAGLDVFDQEPTGPTNPLFELPNVIVTPHIASYTHEGLRRMGIGAVEQVLQVLQGKRPRNLVNPEVWETGNS
ncbi:MAG: hydroxyacid dehydrogenase [Anaerolineae bacterium]